MSLPLPRLNALPLGAHSLSALTDEALFESCGVRIAFTGRGGGVSQPPYESLNTGGHVGDDPARVLRNRGIVLQGLGFADAPLVVPNQVHGTRIVQVESALDVPRANDEACEGADAVLVRCAGVAAMLNFADCLPLILVAPNGLFAVVHAGWRGALSGIAGIAADALARSTASSGCDASSFNAYIGPHIRSECFETDVEVAAQFTAKYGDDVLEGERNVSLSRVVATDLARAGLVPQRIADARVCTACSTDRYFSYRMENVCGRQAAVAIRKEA